MAGNITQLGISLPVPVQSGGTGGVSATAYAPVCGGITSTDDFQSADTGIATSGYVLTSNGASALPSFQASAGSNVTIAGDSGGAQSGPAFTITGASTGLTFAGVANTETLGGTLVVSNGGTGAATLTGVLIGHGTSAITGNAITQYDVLVGGAGNAISSISPSATVGIPLISIGSSANPAFGTALVPGGGTGIITTTAYAPICGGTTATGNFQAASTGLSTSGYILTSTGASSLPTFQAPAASSITITGDSGGGLTGSSFTFTGGTTGLTFGGAITTETLGGTLVVSNGGTGAATLTGVLIGHGTSAVTGNAITQYDVLVGGASNAITSVAPSATSGVPLISQGSSSNPAFGTAVVAGGGTGAVTLTGVLIGNGTSAVTGNAVTQYDVLVGGASNAISSIAPSATSGVPLISSGSSANPSFGTAVVAGGGTGIATTTAYAPICGGTTATGAFQAATTGLSTSGYVLTSNGSSALPSWQAGSGGGITWNDTTGGSANLVKGNGYIADSGSLTTFTMPTNNAIGDTIYVVGKGSGGWKIVYGTSQNIIFGSSTTTTTTGSLASTNANDCVTMVCTTASATIPIFTVMTSIGNITVA